MRLRSFNVAIAASSWHGTVLLDILHKHGEGHHKKDGEQVPEQRKTGGFLACAQESDALDLHLG